MPTPDWRYEKSSNTVKALCRLLRTELTDDQRGEVGLALHDSQTDVRRDHGGRTRARRLVDAQHGEDILRAAGALRALACADRRAGLQAGLLHDLTALGIAESSAQSRLLTPRS